MSGRLIGVVGPSGVGKDTLMRAIAEADPAVSIVRRVITRAPGLGGEDYDAVDPDTFRTLKAEGAFCVDWQAHGLHYGIPASTGDRVAAGETYLVNLSRAVLTRVAGMFSRFTVLNVTADPKVIASRLARRGRESNADIADRLARRVDPLPGDLHVVTLENNGTIEQAVDAALRGLNPERA